MANATIKTSSHLAALTKPGTAKKEAHVRMSHTLTAFDTALKKSLLTKFTARHTPKLISSKVYTTETEIVGKLSYRQVYSDLSKFPYTWKWGNINSGASRKGRVHTVEVVRGKFGVIKGKGRRGGFVLLGKGGKALVRGKHGTQMVSRTSDKKYPVTLLLGPSTSMMIGWSMNNDNKVQDILSGYTYSLDW